eukprot:TRINITY_DN121354_c0_g1_i1.p1 TRINITY_DN121354_c0_g1~~TRINITY_DN121354_c0_g1_i1.p1  ORF type:complete len:511 (+),score=48.24 TRINITY_DN121354_c0_g1_i1:102-1634(+)
MKTEGPEKAPALPAGAKRATNPLAHDPNSSRKQDASFADLLQSPKELWLIFALKALLSLSYFSLFNVLVLFLTDDLGLSDAAAGWVYGAHGMTVGVLSLMAGTMVDKLGARVSLIAGSALLAVGHGMLAFASSAGFAIFALLTLKALGSALVMPALIVSLRRYSSPETRPLAYSLFYVVMNASAALSAFAIVGARSALSDTSSRTIIPASYSTWRVVAIISFFTVCAQFLLSLTLQPSPAEERLREQSGSSQEQSSWETSKEIVSEARFWRLLTLVLLMIGVRSLFRHMDVTFPKYFLRTFGPDAPFEYFLAVNPICIICLAPPITILIQHLNLSYATVFTLGAFISGCSPFFLVLDSTSQSMCLAFLVTLSVGEAVWSPKLYEYSVAVAPVGREASYSALSGLPVFLTTAFIGGFSGHAVQHYCPAYEACDGRMLWLLIAASAAVTPVTLLLLRPWVFNDDDLRDEHLGGMEDRADEEAVLQKDESGAAATKQSANYGTVREPKTRADP